MSKNHTDEQGIATVGILVGLLVVVTLGLGGFGAFSYINYLDQRDNTDVKIDAAVSKAVADQSKTDQAAFAEQAKLPNTDFSGPADFGSVEFKFPKTWSVYLGNTEDGSSGTYTAYFNPARVPTVSSDQQFALRLLIESQSYEQTLASYANAVKKGTLRSSIVTTNGLSGTRLDGQFSKTINGSAIIFKIRDKTLTLRTDSPTFVDDFNESVFSSLTFTP